jgi:hypothetical protein
MIQIQVQPSGAKYSVTLQNDAAVAPTPSLARYVHPTWTDAQKQILDFVQKTTDPNAKAI